MLEINLKEILKNRVPKKKQKFIPGWLVTALEKFVRQEELNKILAATYPKEGSEFSKAVLEYLDITVEVEGLDELSKEGRYLFASNHPLGGLDGITLIALLGEKFGDSNVKFLVNDMLMHVEPLRPVFLPINKYGSQGRDATQIINNAYASDDQMLIFPAGLVSRLQKDGIQDLEWKKAFVVKSIQSQRDIVPVRFEALNSNAFYRVARLRKRLGIKVNLEQAMLPGELCKSAHKNFRVTFGKPIPWQKIQSLPGTPSEKAAAIKRIVYTL